jgi:dihydropteroate synthase
MTKGRHIDIMGIVNLTDDSFYAESRCSDIGTLMERVSHMVQEGATILDVGACSTRPGSVPVGPEVEWERLEPALKAIREAYPHIPISIDTCWSEVVQKAYDYIGDFIVNDISSGENDPQMLPVVGRLGLRYIAMHMRGTSETMQDMTQYDDVVQDVVAYFHDFAQKALDNGIKDWILDPGFGFAKTTAQNYQMMRELRKFRLPYAPGRIPQILVGVSRKSMIYRTLGISPDEALAPTQAVHMAALLNGADILRVHDVAPALQTVRLFCCLDWPNL